MNSKFIRKGIFFIAFFIATTMLISFAYQYDEYMIKAHHNGEGFSIVAYMGKEKNVEIPAQYKNQLITAIDGYQTTGKGAFQNSEVEKVVLQEGIKKIGVWDFGGCKNMTEIQLPKSLIRMDSYVFVDCINLKSITIPSGVTSMGNYIFYGCNHLEVITFESEKPPLLENSNTIFLGVPESLILRVPQGSIDDYQNANGWRQYSNKMVPNK